MKDDGEKNKTSDKKAGQTAALEKTKMRLKKEGPGGEREINWGGDGGLFLSTLRLAWFIFVVSADQPSEKEKEGTY